MRAEGLTCACGRFNMCVLKVEHVRAEGLTCAC